MRALIVVVFLVSGCSGWTLSSGLAGYNAEVARQERARRPRACSFSTECDPDQVCAKIDRFRSDGACVAKR